MSASRPTVNQRRRRTPQHVIADPMIKVQVDMPSSLYVRLREFSVSTKLSLSRLCRDGARSEMERRLLEQSEFYR